MVENINENCMPNYSTGETAKAYGVSVSTIIRLIKKHKLPYKKDKRGKRVISESTYHMIGSLPTKMTGRKSDRLGHIITDQTIGLSLSERGLPVTSDRLTDRQDTKHLIGEQLITLIDELKAQHANELKMMQDDKKQANLQIKELQKAYQELSGKVTNILENEQKLRLQAQGANLYLEGETDKPQAKQGKKEQHWFVRLMNKRII